MHINPSHSLGFSESGLLVKADRYLARSVALTLSFGPEDGALAAELRELGLIPLMAEVRWGRALASGGAEHGLEIKNLSRPQRKRLLAILCARFAAVEEPLPEKKAA